MCQLYFTLKKPLKKYIDDTDIDIDNLAIIDTNVKWTNSILF